MATPKRGTETVDTLPRAHGADPVSGVDDHEKTAKEIKAEAKAEAKEHAKAEDVGEPAIYERWGGQSFDIGLGQGKRIPFTPSRLEEIHECNVDSRDVQEASGLNRAQLIEEIEKQDEFKKSVPAKLGIWKKTSRLTEEDKLTRAAQRADLLSEFPDAALKEILRARNVAIPINPTHAELVDLCKGTSAKK